MSRSFLTSKGKRVQDVLPVGPAKDKGPAVGGLVICEWDGESARERESKGECDAVTRVREPKRYDL